ncbi:MAG: Asp-tRNA(Asn)/Glu-tRNA(Gln) amidotransferase GatCAB subunit A [Candidatus Nephthysia bennettiae]|nr:MAG: Asp-tRNA(Asn)/Glu-tRNA(Gln) amidotransferase GatCAB subunit A [Candidatus Dormibacteraeota bacterium]
MSTSCSRTRVRAEELTGLTIEQAARLLRSRTISSVELTQATLDRIQALEGRLHAFITVTSDLAVAQARRAEREIARGDYRGPLHGIPVTLKDLYWTRGIRTTAGSKILADFVPDRDATATARLAAAGAVLVGKANMHEFAIGATTENPFYGTCHNPWNLEHIPGGSSGGSAAAVAAGLGLASLGSCTGGSIRIPAAFCGIVGLKPTYGLVPRTGIVPNSSSLDHGGPMTRTAADAAAVLEAIAGADGSDPSAVTARLTGMRSIRRRSLQGLRVGVPRNYYFDVVDPEVDALVRAAITELRKLGATVTSVTVPDVELSLDTCVVVAWSECANQHRRWLLSRPHDYGADTLDYLTGALLYRATDYVQAQRVRARIRHSVREVFRRIDVIVSPTGVIPASPIGQTEFEIDERSVPVLSVMARITCIANLTGEPAVSVPCGFTKAGLPVGLQIHGRALEDATVLRVAHAYEQATGWTSRTPPLDLD